MNIRLIGTEADYRKALAEIERLWDAKEGSADAEKLELLGMLVHNYERSRQPLAGLDPIEAIKFRMEQQGLTRKDLESMIGSRARVSEILNRKRNLTLAMVRRLKFDLGISADSLIGSTRPTAHNSASARSAHKAHSAQALTTKRMATTGSQTKKAVGS